MTNYYYIVRFYYGFNHYEKNVIATDSHDAIAIATKGITNNDNVLDTITVYDVECKGVCTL